MPNVSSDAAKTMAERRRQWQARVSEAGHEGLMLLQQAKRLSLSDRGRLAKNLEPAVRVDFPQRHPEMPLYKLLQHAGLTEEPTTRVLGRLITTEGTARDDLTSDPDKFLRLINALAELLPEDLGVIAERALAGTSFDLKSYTMIDEAEVIYRALQMACIRVNRQYSLLADCQHIASIRRKTDDEFGEREMVEGGLCSSADPEMIWPLYQYPIPTMTSDNAYDISSSINAFWSRDITQFGPWAAGVCGNTDLLYFPHIWLGEVLSPDTVNAFNLKARAAKAHLKVVGEYDSLKEIFDEPLPTVKFNEDCQCYIFDEWGAYTGDKATWLVMYPSPDMYGLVPALYQPGEVGGGYLLPLNPNIIAGFADEKQWWYLKTDPTCKSLYDRIKQLVTIGVSGVPLVEEHWMETAKRFRFNPVIRNYKPTPWVAAIEKYLREEI